MPTAATRLEHDLLGDKAVPADAYYGVQTAAPWTTSISRAFNCGSIPISSEPSRW
jgi:aspartate ammonia-lyase